MPAKPPFYFYNAYYDGGDGVLYLGNHLHIEGLQMAGGVPRVVDSKFLCPRSPSIGQRVRVGDSPEAWTVRKPDDQWAKDAEMARELEAMSKERSGSGRAGARKGYQGHPSWAAWNVSLWIANDEPLYRAALDYKRRYGVDAASHMLDALHAEGVTHTPDGAKFTVSNLRHALRDL